MQTSALAFINDRQLRKDLTPFAPGDTVRVHWKVKEGDKERTQAFEGTVIRKTKGGIAASFTVRKLSFGVGVERIFPLHSPRYEKIEVVQRGDVRRNRLFYLRELKGRAARVDKLEDEMMTTGAAQQTEAPAAAAK